MNTKQLIAACLITLLPLSSAWAAESLADIYELAKQKDPRFRAAEAQRLGIYEKKPQARAGVLPQIGLGGSYFDGDVDRKRGLAGEGGYTRSGYGLELRQTIFNKDQFTQLDQADIAILQADLNYQNAEQDLIVRTARLYFEVLAAQDNLTFARSEKKAIEQQLFQTKQRFEVGLTAITDVHESQARYDQSVAQEIAAENQLSIAIENLREITGQYHESLAPLTDRMPLVPPNPADIDAWVKMAMEQNLALLSQERATELAGENVTRQKSGHYPVLDLVARHTYSDFEGDDPNVFTENEAVDNSIGVELTVPIYQGGGVSASVREAEYQYQEARELLEQRRRETWRQTRSAYLNVIDGISGVRALKQVLISNQTALEATKAGFDVGTRTAVDVLNSQRDLFRAESNYAQVRYGYIVNAFLLYQAAGMLTEEHLRKANEWLGTAAATPASPEPGERSQ
jgi:outer membrane protein